MLQQGRHAALLGGASPEPEHGYVEKLTCSRAAQECSAPQHDVDSEKITRVGRMTNLKCAAFQGCPGPGLQGFHNVWDKALHGPPCAGRVARAVSHRQRYAGRFAGLFRTDHFAEHFAQAASHRPLAANQPNLWRTCLQSPIRASYSCLRSAALVKRRRQGIRKYSGLSPCR